MKTKKQEVAVEEPKKSDTIEIGAGMFSLVPKDLAEAMQLAKLIAESDLAPKDFKGKPENVLIAVQMGAEIGISPMQSIQNIAVINGKPSIYGDMGKALLLKKGCRIEERDTKEIKAKGEAWCQITRPDGSPPTVRTYSVDNAKEASLWGKQGPWTTNTWRQMAWRAFWFAARDGAADMLRGLAGVEEVRDYIDITPEPKDPEKFPALPQRISEKAAATVAQQEYPDEDPNDSVEDPPPPKDQRKPIDLKAAKKTFAKFDAPCRHCNIVVVIGEEMIYVGDGPNKGRYHEGCVRQA